MFNDDRSNQRLFDQLFYLQNQIFAISSNILRNESRIMLG